MSTEGDKITKMRQEIAELNPGIEGNIFNMLRREWAGSSHAITGYKVGTETLPIYITLWHENYVPTTVEVYFHAEHEMDDRYGDTKLYADLDVKTGEVSGNISGVKTLEDYLRLCYFARQGEVVRDDS